MFAPKVTHYDGQSAGIADQRQHPFVTGDDPKADGRMASIVSVADEGLSFVLTPKAHEDKSVTLAVLGSVKLFESDHGSLVNRLISAIQQLLLT